MGKLESFTFKSMSYNMVLQVSFRLISFILNAVLFRHVNTELIGACNFRLTLLYTTVMFLSREPFRRALPTLQAVKKDAQLQSFLNSLWLVVLNGAFLSSLFGYLWSSNHLFDKPNPLQVPYYDLSVYLCCLACVIELCGEPSNNLLQMLYLAKHKVLIEASSLLIFNFVFVFLAIKYPNLGALAYSIARLINSLLNVLSNFYFISKNKSLLSDHVKLGPDFSIGHRFDKEYLSLVRVYYSQSVFKQLLTEGERYLITAFSMLSFSESGIYDIVNNLGSLLARFLFLPIEDATYFYFTNSLKRGVKYSQQQQKEQNAKSYFELLLRSLSLIGLLVMCFGQGYSKLLLQLYGGDLLGQNDLCINMLRLHCVYIYFLAINGITEGFFNATMSESQLRKHNFRLVLFSVIFLLFAFSLASLFGAYGFLLSNLLNMSLRIGFSCFYISGFFAGYEFANQNEIMNKKKRAYNIWTPILPGLLLGFVLISSLILIKFSEAYYFSSDKEVLVHLFIGILIFVFNILVILKQEKQIRLFLFDFLKKFKRN
jgi:oligosaccharide translocation protein RFT1